MGSTGAPIASSSAAMLARLIRETYLSVVAFGLRRASAKVPRRLDDAQRSIHGIAEKIGEKFRNELASLRFGHPLAHQYPAVLGDRQDAAFRVETGLQLRQLFVAHQHDEMDLRQPC